MSGFKTEEIKLSITYTTNGKVVNKIKSASNGCGSVGLKQVLVAYLEQFCDMKVQKVDKNEFRRELDLVVNKYLSYDRENV